jgi:hypothetical protein
MKVGGLMYSRGTSRKTLKAFIWVKMLIGQWCIMSTKQMTFSFDDSNELQQTPEGKTGLLCV